MTFSLYLIVLVVCIVVAMMVVAMVVVVIVTLLIYGAKICNGNGNGFRTSPQNRIPTGVRNESTPIPFAAWPP